MAVASFRARAISRDCDRLSPPLRYAVIAGKTLENGEYNYGYNAKSGESKELVRSEAMVPRSPRRRASRCRAVAVWAGGVIGWQQPHCMHPPPTLSSQLSEPEPDIQPQ